MVSAGSNTGSVFGGFPSQRRGWFLSELLGMGVVPGPRDASAAAGRGATLTCGQLRMRGKELCQRNLTQSGPGIEGVGERGEHLLEGATPV